MKKFFGIILIIIASFLIILSLYLVISMGLTGYAPFFKEANAFNFGLLSGAILSFVLPMGVAGLLMLWGIKNIKRKKIISDDIPEQY